MTKTKEKENKKKRKGNQVNEKLFETIGKLPSLMETDGLVGKRVQHRFIDGKTGKEEWFAGTVIRRGRGKFEEMFYVRYDGDKDVYKFPLLEDWDNGDLKFLEVKVGDFVEKKILHLYVDDKTGKESWYEAYVADVDEESKDLTNPDFLFFMIMMMTVRMKMSTTCVSC